MRPKTKWASAGQSGRAPEIGVAEPDADLEDGAYEDGTDDVFADGGFGDGGFGEDRGAPATGDAGVDGGPLGANVLVRALRACSGAVAVGIVVLALVVVVTAVLGARRHFPGPGAESLTVHILAAVAVLIAQHYADRRRGLVAVAAALAVPAIAGAVLWTQWWT